MPFLNELMFCVVMTIMLELLLKIPTGISVVRSKLGPYTSDDAAKEFLKTERT